MNRDPGLDPFSPEADPCPPDRDSHEPSPESPESRAPRPSSVRSETGHHASEDPSRRTVGKLMLCAATLGLAEGCVPYRLACETLPDDAATCRHRFCRYYSG